MKTRIVTTDMYTPEGERLASDTLRIPWHAYPRPHLRRDSFFCLNGDWDFSAVTCGDPLYDERIRVPFVPQSILSGIHRHIQRNSRLCYRKTFSLPDGFVKGRVILHIGAADQRAEVFLNGERLGEHTGGYDSFSFDITEYIIPENTVEIFVTDDHGSRVLPYGKQCERRGGMWYTPISGIWQTVWIESVPSVYVSEIRVRADLSGADVTVVSNAAANADGRVILHLPRGDREYRLISGRVRIEPDEPILWTPDDPHLYEFTVILEDDSVSSYFALRTVGVGERNGTPCILFNGEPLFFHGLLDQGYFSDGIFLPAEPEGFDRDILAAKEMGFNMLRKHIKQEPELFYYACDRLGMIVFQDMVNNGRYSFFRDTVLPTVGLKKRNDKRMHRDAETRAEFMKCTERTVSRLSFHPSVCYWTIFNEGWGQFDHPAAYKRLKELDPSRPADSVSGWFSSPKETVSDVESLHVYFKPVKISPSEKPTVLSEFGGYSYKIADHSFNTVKNYGYGKFDSKEEFESAVEKLYLEQIAPAIRMGLCGAVYTQLTDVEDETNGLITYDRRVTKVSPEKMRKIAETLFRVFNEAHTEKNKPSPMF